MPGGEHAGQASAMSEEARARLHELVAIKQSLDASDHSTSSATALLQLALSIEKVDMTRLELVKKIGTGAFADVMLYRLDAGVQPPISQSSSISSAISIPSDTSRTSPAPPASRWPQMSLRRRSKSLNMNNKASPHVGSRMYPSFTEEVSARSSTSDVKETVVVKWAKTHEVLELNNLTPGERKTVTLPASVAIGLHAEAVLLYSLNHENIVRCLGITTVQDPETQRPVIGLIEEAVMGGTLLHKINAGGYSRHKAIGWLIDVARALRYIHEEIGVPIAHRDLKPENVLIDANSGRAKLADFGLFRFLGQDDSAKGTENQKLLPEGQRALRQPIMTGQTGSNRYMAPENYTKQTDYTGKIDVFSFGIMAWEVLAMKRAYESLYLGADQIVESVAKRGLRPTLPSNWAPELRTLLTSMWAAEAAERPSFVAIVEELELLRSSCSAQLPNRLSLSAAISRVKAAR